VLFVEEGAHFLAAVQVIVYAGAIVVLFLFVIMLLGVDRRESLMAETFRGQRVIVVVLGIVALFEVLFLAGTHWTTGAHSVTGVLRPTGSSGPAAAGATGPVTASNTAVLGKALFTTYLLPFEVTSALLVVAIVATVVLARRPARRSGTRGGEPAEQTIPSDQPLGGSHDVAPAGVLAPGGREAGVGVGAGAGVPAGTVAGRAGDGAHVADGGGA
jgi:NADH-quinone oxidoreductase subunit J